MCWQLYIVLMSNHLSAIRLLDYKLSVGVSLLAEKVSAKNRRLRKCRRSLYRATVQVSAKEYPRWVKISPPLLSPSFRLFLSRSALSPSPALPTRPRRRHRTSTAPALDVTAAALLLLLLHALLTPRGRAGRRRPLDGVAHRRIFFNFNTFCKLILNLTLAVFYF